MSIETTRALGKDLRVGDCLLFSRLRGTIGRITSLVTHPNPPNVDWGGEVRIARLDNGFGISIGPMDRLDRVISADETLFYVVLDTPDGERVVSVGFRVREDAERAARQRWARAFGLNISVQEIDILDARSIEISPSEWLVLKDVDAQQQLFGGMA